MFFFRITFSRDLWNSEQKYCYRTYLELISCKPVIWVTKNDSKLTIRILYFQVDRCPCGSGTTSRVAVQHKKGFLKVNQTRVYEAGLTGTSFTGKVVCETKCGDYDAAVVEISGRAYYCGKSIFTVEDDDPLKAGFLLRWVF